jgi:hypothetical protein
MDFSDILKKIKDNFSPRRDVDLKEASLHFEIEPLTSEEEGYVLEGCKDVEDHQYIDVLKRHTLAHSIKKMNDIEMGDKKEINTKDAEGNPVTKSKFLFLLDFLSDWPQTLIDLLFDAFSDMAKEMESKVLKDAKFKKFSVSEEPAEDEEKKNFRKIEEPEQPIELTETEKMNEQVKKEAETRNYHMAETESKAINK